MFDFKQHMVTFWCVPFSLQFGHVWGWWSWVVLVLMFVSCALTIIFMSAWNNGKEYPGDSRFYKAPIACAIATCAYMFVKLVDVVLCFSSLNSNNRFMSFVVRQHLYVFGAINCLSKEAGRGTAFWILFYSTVSLLAPTATVFFHIFIMDSKSIIMADRIGVEIFIYVVFLCLALCHVVSEMIKAEQKVNFCWLSSASWEHILMWGELRSMHRAFEVVKYISENTWISCGLRQAWLLRLINFCFRCLKNGHMYAFRLRNQMEWKP